MSNQSPNELDRRGQKVGMWTEEDSHGGVMTGEYVEGRRQGVWRHSFVDGSVRSKGTYNKGVVDGGWTWYPSTGGSFSVGDSSRARNMVYGNAGMPTGTPSTAGCGTTG